MVYLRSTPLSNDNAGERSTGVLPLNRNARLTFTAMLLMIAISGKAQCDSAQQVQKPAFRGIIANRLTGVPQSGVCISMSNGKSVTTAWDGTYSISDTAFVTASITKRGFLTRKMRREEFADTLFLIPSAHAIDEVTVWGRRGDNARFYTPMSKTDAELTAIGGNLNANILGLLILAAKELKIIPEPGKKRRIWEDKQRTIISNY